MHRFGVGEGIRTLDLNLGKVVPDADQLLTQQQVIGRMPPWIIGKGRIYPAFYTGPCAPRPLRSVSPGVLCASSWAADSWDVLGDTRRASESIPQRALWPRRCTTFFG